MSERLVTRVEFLEKSYLRHLETGEKPDLKDLLEQVPPRYFRQFSRFVFETYLETGKKTDTRAKP